MQIARAKITRGGALLLALIYLFSALNAITTASWHRLYHWFSETAYHPHHHFSGEHPQSHHHDRLLDMALRMIASQKSSPGGDAKPAPKLITLQEHLVCRAQQSALEPDRRSFSKNSFPPPQSVIADLRTPPPKSPLS